MEDEAARFRRELEERTGEKVVATTAASLDSDQPGMMPRWGVLVLTSASLRFLDQPSQHWLSYLVQPHDVTSSPEPYAELIIPLGNDVSVTIKKRGTLSRIFSSPFEPLAVSWREDGQDRQESFSVDPRCRLFTALALAVKTDSGS